MRDGIFLFVCEINLYEGGRATHHNSAVDLLASKIKKACQHIPVVYGGVVGISTLEFVGALYVGYFVASQTQLNESQKIPVNHKIKYITRTMPRKGSDPLLFNNFFYFFHRSTVHVCDSSTSKASTFIWY